MTGKGLFFALGVMLVLLFAGVLEVVL